MRRILIALTWMVLVAFATLPHSTAAFRTSDPPPAQDAGATIVPRHGTLISLESLAPLKEAFQRDSGKIRVLALVSPT